MRVILQGRVSTKDQEEGKTIDTQKANTRAYAELNGHEIVEEIWLEAWSGEDLDRPDIHRIRELINTEQIGAVINVNSDRFSRTQTDQLNFLKELDDHNVKHISITQLGAENLTGTAKIANRGINAMMSEFEKIRILERTSSARMRVVNEGNVMTSRPPYGFKYVRHSKDERNRTIKRGHFVHDSVEIENVKLILEWAKEGASNNDTIRKLHDLGIKPRSGSEWWAKSSIQKLLSVNLDFYAGEWSYLKYKHIEPKHRLKKSVVHRTKKSSRQLQPKEDWIKVTLPPELIIISKEDVELIRKRKNNNRSLSFGNTKHDYLLKNYLFSPTCKKGYSCDNTHSVPTYRDRHSVPGDPYKEQCSGGSIKCDTLETAVWNDIRNLILQPELLETEARKFVDTKKDDGVVRSSKLTELQRKRAELSKQLERVDDGFREGFYSVAEAKEQKAKVQSLMKQVALDEQKEIANYKKVGQMDFEGLTKDIRALCEDMATVLENMEFVEKRKILDWMSAKVFYQNHEYSLEGSIPLFFDGSRPQHFNNMVTIQPKISMPFTVTGKLPVPNNKRRG